MTTRLVNAQFAQMPFVTSSPFSRWLVSPDVLDNRQLTDYVHAMAPYALSPSWLSNAPPQSPLIAAFLLGGIPTSKVQDLVNRALRCGDFPSYALESQFSGRNFTDAMALIGFGMHADYLHVDAVSASRVNLRPGTDHSILDLMEQKVPERPSSLYGARQQYLAEIPGAGPFVQHLLHRGAYDESLLRNMARIKWDVCVDTWRIFNVRGGEMSAMARKSLEAPGGYDAKVRITDIKYSNAVNRVFKRSWSELDLVGSPEQLEQDVEKVLARQIIRRLAGGGTRASAQALKVPAATLVGIAVLTGVPVNNLLRFALQDFARRGETFITEQTFDDVDALISESELGMVHFGQEARSELQTLRMTFANWHKEECVDPISQFSRKLRLGSSMLWSRNGAYHLVGSKVGANGQIEDVYEPRLDHKLQGLPRTWPFEV